MVGVITEKDWTEIDRNFPGVHTFYSHLLEKPNTFLELFRLYWLCKEMKSRKQVTREKFVSLGAVT